MEVCLLIITMVSQQSYAVVKTMYMSYMLGYIEENILLENSDPPFVKYVTNIV